MSETIKTKIVEHLAQEAQFALAEAEGEIREMRSKYPQYFGSHSEGAGLDLYVLEEKVKRAAKFIAFLA